MFSMTGYGKAEYCDNGINLIVELKTVNNRNFDFNIKCPRSFIALEDAIRKTVQKFVARGRIDLFVNFTDSREESSKLDVNLIRAKEYYLVAKKVCKELGIKNDVTATSVLKFPEVITENSILDVTDLKEIILNTVEKACNKLNEMRKVEGEKLVADMLNRLEFITQTAGKIALRAPLVAIEHKQKLQARIKEALNDVKYDETRLLNEVAFYTDKVNIDEELTRLNSHVAQFKEIIAQEGAGKKLDFLMQEFNRESNTICSKSNDIEVTKLALSLKNEIEKIREQVQNLE